MYNIEDEIKGLLATALGSTCKKYYVGYVPEKKIPINYLPVLMVYGTRTRLITDRLTTARDKYEFDITVEVVENCYKHASGAGVEADKVLDAQKSVKEIMESRDTNMKPDSDTVLGALRANVTGTDYLYSNVSEITYENVNVDGTMYIKAKLTMTAVSKYNNR